MSVVKFFRQLCCPWAPALDEEPSPIAPRIATTATASISSRHRRAEEEYRRRLGGISGVTHFNREDEFGTLKRQYEAYFRMKPTSSRRWGKGAWWTEYEQLPAVDPRFRWA
ncbi:hypothetical protein ONS95_003516 [Cadophora gregata]|uniref:uncharacterized protein n=1 Tax=Cadophora gregata TaxID=51156 RepID=UPI0026DB2F53|nr:uncharacterized protein ONS95_003516 [Cadophora gregata]KAK0099416.1 hypothetical protein ONS96_008441 [Cadophora gregata f. sp. sojae]KAK0106791.1 hypothetical protein ONS95_003516 [Cadophora gregata]